MSLTGTDHLVLLVADIEAGIRTWRDGMGLSLTHRVSLSEAGIDQAFFLLADGTFLELIAPIGEASPLNAALQGRGEGVHVVAMKVDDLDAAVAGFRERGVRLIGEGTAQVFVHPESTGGVVLQLWPSDRPHRWQSASSETGEPVIGGAS